MGDKKKLRVFLYRPRPRYRTIRMFWLMRLEPLELEYLYTILKPFCEVTLLDGCVSRKNPLKIMRNIGADVVLLTGFITHIDSLLSLSQSIKKLPKKPYVFIGGPHAEVYPEHFYDSTVDGVFFSNQLEGIQETLQRISTQKDFSTIPGAAFRQDNTFIKNKIQPCNPDFLPNPDRILLRTMPSKYRYFFYKNCSSLKTAFGCNGKCSFCFCRKMNGGHYTPRSMQNVMNEIGTIESQNIFILDDNFLICRNRLQEFCSLIEKLNITKNFIIYGTALFISKNPDILHRLRKSGVRGVIVGFEFIDDSLLDHFQKNTRRDDNDRCIQICQECDIDLFALFMTDPQWPKENFIKLAEYIKMKNIIFATFSTLTPFPGTLTYSEDKSYKLSAWWRYDLLRVHSKPLHFSTMYYYCMLLYLYLLPFTRISSNWYLIRRYGLISTLNLGFRSIASGIEYLFKIALWP